MLAPQEQKPNVIDELIESMEEWYEAIDNAVKKRDLIPGSNEYTVATSIGNAGKLPKDYWIIVS